MWGSHLPTQLQRSTRETETPSQTWGASAQAGITEDFYSRHHGKPLTSIVDTLGQCVEKQRHYFAYKGPYSQCYGFSSGHVRILELDNKKGWAPTNWCFWTVVLVKTLESPWDSKEIQTVHAKRNLPWICIGKTDAEAETPVLWPPDAKNWLFGRLWCWERLKAGEKGDDRGWDGWMASPTRWTWVWVNSGSLWWTNWEFVRPGMLQSMRSQGVGHDWATELNWTGKIFLFLFLILLI